MINDNTLLPCPFCGGKAERNDKLTKGVEGVVACSECGAATFASQWNTRTDAERLAAAEEALKELTGVSDDALWSLICHYHLDTHIYPTPEGIYADWSKMDTACANCDMAKRFYDALAEASDYLAKFADSPRPSPPVDIITE
jgi:Restriction alleviation protein Lar